MKLVVAFAPGGVADIMGRLVAQLLQHKLGGTFIVENKPGGDGLIGMGEVVRAAPDGYTLLIGGFGGQIVPPLMKDDFPFDVRRDIVKIAMTAEFANVLVVNKSLPVNSVSGADRLSEGASRQVEFRLVGPRDLRSSGGRDVHARDRHQDAQRAVSRRRGRAQRHAGGNDAGDVPAIAGGDLGLATSGAVKPLAVTSSYRLWQLPDVPTLSETVLPGYHVASWNMLFAPRGLPDTIRKTLSDALVEAVKDPKFRERMQKIGVEPVGRPFAEADVFFERELHALEARDR